MSKLRSAATVLAAALLCAAPTAAGVITGFAGASGPGLASMSFNSVDDPAIGNDNVVGDSPNVIWINQKAFDSTAYIDMVFTVEDFGVPTTEYTLSEGVFNGTGEDWIGYQVRLGYGTGAGFTEVTFGDGLDFDDPDFDSPPDFSPYTTITGDFGVTNAVDGPFLNGAFHVFTFNIDVPNGITEFTVRQEPRAFPVSDEDATWGGVKGLFR